MAVSDRRKREREARLQLILNAALKTFARQGYHGTSMEVIAEEAELGKATLYYYFKGKDELLISILETGLKEFFEQLDIAWQDEKDITEKIRKITEVGALFFASHPDYFRLYNYLTAHPTLRRKAMAELHPLVVEKTHKIRALFQAARQNKLIRELPTNQLIEIFGSLVMGMGLFSHPGISRETLLQKARLINEIFFNGVLVHREEAFHV